MSLFLCQFFSRRIASRLSDADEILKGENIGNCFAADIRPADF